MENAELHEMAVRDQRRSRELELAHDVLRGILPKAPARIEGYEFFDFYEPALEPGRRLLRLHSPAWQSGGGGRGRRIGQGRAGLALWWHGFLADVRNCLANEPDAGRGGRATKPRLHGRRLGRPLRDAVACGARSAKPRSLTLVDAGHPPAYLCQNGTVIESVSEARHETPIGSDRRRGIHSGELQAQYWRLAGDLYGRLLRGNESTERAFMVLSGCKSRWGLPWMASPRKAAVFFAA